VIFRPGRAAAVILLALLAGTASGDRPSTRTQMQTIFGALSTALNLTLYDTPFKDEEHRAMITEALSLLADSAAALEAHDELGPEYSYVRRSLARDAREAVLHYRQEHYAGAGFLLRQLVSNCVSCHDKLPASDNYDLGRAFVDRARIEDIPASQLAQLMVATRQFESALDTYEDLFRSGEHPPRELLANGDVAEYMKVGLRAMDEGDRVCATLRELRYRDDVAVEIASQIVEWVRVISSFERPSGARAELHAARVLIRDARNRKGLPGDYPGLAHFVLASGCLLRYLESHPEGEDLSEALYLLGVCDSHMSRSPWMSETEFYLESAVRADPSSRYAVLAMDFLETWVNEQYSGSGGMVVPEDTRERLGELRSLISH
jgi:hypothetical protein